MTTAPISSAAVAITGGAHGIGRAIAEGFAGAGARVAIGDLDAGAARSLAAQLGHGAIGMALDVTDRAAFTAFLDAAQESHGPLEIMINNAGVDWMGPFHEEPDQVSRHELEVNLLGTILGTRLALQRMLPRRHGHVVNIASGAGRVPLPGSAVYAATKHGIVGLTESLRLEYRGSGVRFSLVHPSQVKTAMLQGQPQPRLLPQIGPEDVARAVLDAVREDTFEVWVPASQAMSVKLGNMLPRPLREGLMRALGVGRIAGEADLTARREYHERAFGRS